MPGVRPPDFYWPPVTGKRTCRLIFTLSL